MNKVGVFSCWTIEWNFLCFRYILPLGNCFFFNFLICLHCMCPTLSIHKIWNCRLIQFTKYIKRCIKFIQSHYELLFTVGTLLQTSSIQLFKCFQHDYFPSSELKYFSLSQLFPLTCHVTTVVRWFLSRIIGCDSLH